MFSNLINSEDCLNHVDKSWNDGIFTNDIKEEFKNIINIINKKIEKDGEEVLPENKLLILNAFNLCTFPPKIVIIGQDCYAYYKNQAMGLSFSVPENVQVPPSLKNIFLELNGDIKNFNIPTSGDLSFWAKQKVLLFNIGLTVKYNHSGSHLELWKDFSYKIIKLISDKSPLPIVFMLWGSFAKNCKSLINSDKHLILEANHPSPQNVQRYGNWFGNKHFSKANAFLKKNSRRPIIWNL